MAINLSPVQINNARLKQAVSDALKDTGLPGNRLVLEITESTLLSQSATTLDLLRYLREQGIRIAMDDFGTGYSSLSYLLSFPFDLVKIDRSFIAKLGTVGEGADSTAVVRAMIEVASALGMKVVAEGVETDDQLRRLQSLGCAMAQGYYFSKPRPAAELAGFVPPAISSIFAAA